MIAFLLNNRLSRAIGAALVAIAGIWAYGAAKQRKGRKEGAERVSRRALAAGEARKGKRDEIDDDVAGGNAVDRLRSDWSRD